MRDKLTRVAVRTSLWYAFFASLWIALSGVVLALLVRNAHMIEKLEISKGWIFVAVTAFLLYGVLRRQMRRLAKEAKAREQAEQLVHETQERFATIFRSSPVGITLSKLDTGRLVDANPAFLSMLGYDRKEVMGRTAQEMGVFASPRDRESFVETIRTHGRVDGVEAEVRKKSGETGTWMGSSELITLAGEPHLLTIMLDITDKKNAEEALKESESRFRNAFEASAIGMALVGLDGRWLKVNRSLCESVGYAEDELLTKTFKDITHSDDIEKDREHLKRLVQDEIPYYHIEKRYLHRDGYLVWVLLCVSMVRNEKGYPLYFVCQIEDITERKLLEEELRAALITDELTGLYNRGGFFERSDETLWSAPRRGETALLFLVKLDDMKRINDTVGQKAGDAIITDVGRMLRETFREKDVIGRIGGVEFAILATGTEETVNRLVAHLEDVASTFEKSDGRSCSVSLSIESALSRPHEARSLEELIARANETMLKERRAEGAA
ncbi:MAG: PAS domain S-box protein [Syntrophorhabdales bacterium]|jgi:PAS domain S-box-containing protein/diguanylate cyclase (GGDEF)-like protein